MTRRALAGGWAVSAGAALFFACSSFDAEPEASGDAGADAVAPADATKGDDGSVDPGEDANAAFDFSHHPPCPRPAQPGAACSASPSGCKRTLLHKPAVRSHTWGIVADARHVFWLSQPMGLDGYNGKATATLHRVDRKTGEVVELAREQSLATSLYTNGPDLFWTAQSATSGFQLRSVRKDAPPCDATGCSAPKNVASGLGPIAHIGGASPDSLFVVQTNGGVSHVVIDPPNPRSVGATSDFPGFVAGSGAVFVSGGYKAGVLRFSANGDGPTTLGSIVPRDAGTLVGAFQLMTSCSHVYAMVAGKDVERVGATATGDGFSPFSKVPGTLDVYDTDSDARFLYFGAANSGGLHRIDHTAEAPTAEQITGGNVWRIDVRDDVIAYGEHGASGTDAADEVGSIFLIEK